EFELDAAPPAEAALEHRELHPFAVTVHQAENAAPAALVRDVVGDDVEVLVGAAPAQRSPALHAAILAMAAVAAHQRGSIAGSSAISPIKWRPKSRACTSSSRR